MKNVNGELVVSCCMADDAINHGNCATCMYHRGWWNTSCLHEPHAGEPDTDYCGDKSAVTRKEA